MAEPCWTAGSGCGRSRRACNRLNTVGTKKSVATVATKRPPITARPSGAFCSPPSPSANAIGSMPMIMASAVISTGRKRVKPASSAAAAASRPCAKPFAREAHEQNGVCGRNAHAHDGAGQRRHRQRRSGHEQHPDDSGQCSRQGGNDDERIEPGLEVDDDDEIDEQNCAGEPEIKLAVGAGHGLNLAAQHDIGAVRNVLSRFLQNAIDIGGQRAEIATLDGAVNVHDRLHVVMRHDARAGAGRDLGKSAQILQGVRLGGRERYVDEIRHRVDAILRHLRDDRIGDPILRIEPEIRVHLLAAGQSDQQAVGDVTLGEADLAGKRAIDLDIDLRVVEHLLDAQVGDAGHRTDALEKIGRISVVGFLIVADHLHVDRRRQAEIEDLRDDVGRQER